MRSSILTSATFFLALSFVGCNESTDPKVEPAEEFSTSKPDWKLVTLHIDGFKKSKSGGIWMSWPNRVKQALEGLEAVRDIRMDLERNEFVVNFDASGVDEALLIATITKEGFAAGVASTAQATEDPTFFKKKHWQRLERKTNLSC